MLGKAITGITFLTLLVVMSGCTIFAQPTIQATITPITVNTLSVFNTPAPTFTRQPTSTRDPRPTSTFVPTPTYSGTLTLTPTPIPTIEFPSARNPTIDFPTNLVLDEWELTENSQLARGFFDTLQGTEEQIIEKYKSIDGFTHFPSPLIQGQGYYSNYKKVMLNGYELKAVEEYIGLNSIIHIVYDGKEISRVDAGYGYAIPNTWGLWTYQNHWILEYINVFRDPYERTYLLGNIIWDGESFNSKFDYQESFGLTAIDGRILYFFRRNDKIGIVYDGKEYNLDYDLVPHYECCEIGFYINPRAIIGIGLQGEQTIGFFAERDGIKYYVVIWAK